MEAQEVVRRIGLPIIKRENGLYACPVCEVWERAEPNQVGVHFVTHWSEIGVKHPPTGKDMVDCPFDGCTVRRARHGLISHLGYVHDLDRATATGVARTAGFNLDVYLAGPPPKKKGKGAYRSIKDLSPEDQETLRAHWREEAARRREEELARKRGGLAVEEVNCPLCEFKCLRKNLSAHLQTKRHGLSRDEANRVARDGTAARQPRNLPARVEAGPEPVVSGLIDPTDAAIAVVQSQVNGHGVPAHLLPDVMHYVELTRELAAKLREA